MHAQVSVNVFVHVCIYIYIYIYMCVCVCLCVCVCVMSGYSMCGGGGGGHRALICSDCVVNFAPLAHTTSMMCAEPQQVCPRRFGLNYDPPAIILEYLEVRSHSRVLRRTPCRHLQIHLLAFFLHQVKTGKLFHRKV